MDHPYDTPLPSGLRFAVEVIAWVAGSWAAADFSIWLAPVALVVLVGLPSVFSTVGDKRNIVVATPGSGRLLIELLLHAVAVAAPWLVWPPFVAAPTTLIVIAAITTGAPRSLWLLRGALLDPSHADEP